MSPLDDLDWTLERRPRVTRRLHLELDAEGGLVVVAPPRMHEAEVALLLTENRRRVDRFLEQARARQLPPLRWQSGETHLFGGEALVLTIHRHHGRGSQVRVEGGKLVVSLSDPRPEAVRKALQRWYTKHARTLFQERFDHWRQAAEWTAGRPLKLDLRRMKRTWGTCRPNGTIRLNTHLVKAPQSTLDSVICHELCHLAEMNHGPRFYALQERLYPDWRREKARLRHEGHRYVHE